MPNLHEPLLRPLAVAATLALSSLACSAQSSTATLATTPPAYALNIPAQPATQSLQQLIEQTRIQLVYSPELVQGLTTKAVSGHFTPLQALVRMLDGSGLQVVETGVNAWTIRPTQPTSGPNGDRTRLDSVIVSASRRNEPVREVPMQVSVLDADQLGRKGARSLQDYLADQAGVNLRSSTGGPGAGTVSIRGITTGSQTINTVGVYVDEVAFGSSGPFAGGGQLALDLGLLDLKHIELLRGPQGTLYGAGAMGGVLKYVTHEPDTAEWSGRLTLGLSAPRGGGIGHTAGAVVNVPLKEDLAGLRLSAFNDHHGGTVDAIGPRVFATHVDRGDTRGLRGSLLITPTSRVKIRATGMTQTIRREGSGLVEYRLDDRQPLLGGRQIRLYVPQPYEVKVDLLSADVEYDFGWARINAILSRQRMVSQQQVDTSLLDLQSLPALGLSSTQTNGRIALHKNTQELRLTSRADRQLAWLLGFYANDETSTNDQLASGNRVDGTPGPELIRAALPARYKEMAAYGDITWKFANGVAVTGGLRVARNRQHFTQITSGPLVGGSRSLPGASRDTSRTWLLTARYALNPHSDVYLRGATGYRPGGPNPVVNDPVTGEPTGVATFKHDTLTSLEAGYKAELLDRRLTLEAAVFDIRWKDLQQFKTGREVTTIVNAGAAHVRGAELGLSWRPDPRWTLAGNAAFVDARLSEDAPGLGAVAGDRLPVSPRLSAALSARYAFSLAGHPGHVGLTQRYASSRRTGFGGNARTAPYTLPGYAVTDLEAGLDFRRVQLSFFVRNLFDRAAQLSGGNALVQPSDSVSRVVLESPRTVGATLTVPF